MINNLQDIIYNPDFFIAWQESNGTDSGWAEGLMEETGEDSESSAIQVRFNEDAERFISQFNKHAQIQGDMIVGTRSVNKPNAQQYVNDLASGKIKEVGIYWSWDAEKASPHWSGSGQEVHLRAFIPFDAIDMEKTAMANVNNEEEAEITVRGGSTVFLLSASYGKKIIDLNEQEVKVHQEDSRSFKEKVTAYYCVKQVVSDTDEAAAVDGKKKYQTKQEAQKDADKLNKEKNPSLLDGAKFEVAKQWNPDGSTYFIIHKPKSKD